MRKREIKPNAIYTTDELATLFKLSRRTIQRLVKTGKIKDSGNSKNHRILGSSVLEYLKK